MLEQLAREIQAGGTLEIGALAARLGTTPQLIQAMLEHLQRSGLVRPYANCGEGCRRCGLRDACNPPPAIRIWQSKPKD